MMLNPKALCKECMREASPIARQLDTDLAHALLGLGRGARAVIMFIVLVAFPFVCTAKIMYRVAQDYINYRRLGIDRAIHSPAHARSLWKALHTRYVVSGFDFYRQLRDRCTEVIANDQSSLVDDVHSEWLESWKADRAEQRGY